MILFAGIFIMLLFALSFVLFFFFSQRKFQGEQVKAQRRELDYQQQLLFTSITTQEQERERIARDLHDEIGSKLNVVNLHLHRLRKSQDLSPLGDILGVLNQTIHRTRQISHELLPPTLQNFGLVPALEELCEQYREASSLEVAFSANELNPPPNLETALALFRIAQECLSNGTKYSQGQHLALSLHSSPQRLELSYHDDGQGFDPKQAKQGLGLQNMESRSRLIEADLKIHSAPGQGVHITVQKPLV